MNATDYSTLTQGAGLVDWSLWGVVEAAGVDRAAFLHNLLSNDIKHLKPGGSCRAALLTPTAKMIAELVVVVEATHHWLLTPRACLAALLSTLEHYLITENVTLTDRTPDWTLLGVHGPKTPEIAQHLSGIRRADYRLTASPDVLLMASPQDVEALRAKLSSMGAKPVSWEAVHVRRIEAGVPWWGLDMDETTLLPETGLEKTLASFTKGCYVGQEIVARVDTYGSLSRKLMRVVCDGEVVPAAGDAIVKDGEEAGRITSACFSPSMKRPVALGYIKRPHYEAGTAVQIGVGVTATIAALPFR